MYWMYEQLVLEVWTIDIEYTCWYWMHGQVVLDAWTSGIGCMCWDWMHEKLVLGTWRLVLDVWTIGIGRIETCIGCVYLVKTIPMQTLIQIPITNTHNATKINTNTIQTLILITILMPILIPKSIQIPKLKPIQILIPVLKPKSMSSSPSHQVCTPCAGRAGRLTPRWTCCGPPEWWTCMAGTTLVLAATMISTRACPMCPLWWCVHTYLLSHLLTH